MKKNAIFLFVLLWPMVSFAQDKKATASKLKSITVYEQKYEKGTAGKVLPESEVKYDVAGNLAEEIEYKDGKVIRHFTYKYDAANNKIQEVEWDASGKKIKVSEYKYNAQHLRTEKTVFNGNNQVLSKKTYKYETY
jgi:hypothetical protein